MTHRAQARPHRTRQITLLFLVLSLAACSDGNSLPDVSNLTSMPSQNGEKQSAVDNAFNAALSPLEDLGIRKRDIPLVLKQLVNNPYSRPVPLKCESVKLELARLDALLGPDMDAPKLALTTDQQYQSVGGDIANDAIVGLIRSQVSIIPMRGILRKVTGADSHEKAVAKATEAGKLRRAYLRGLAEASFGGKCLPSRTIVAGEDAKDDDTVADAKK